MLGQLNYNAETIVVIGVNSSPVLAETLAKVPIVGRIIQVLTFREYTVNEERFQADIKVPSIQGLENEDLQNSLNEKYLAENKALYEQFMADMQEMEGGEGRKGVSSGYEVVTDDDVIFSIKRYELTVAGSSNTELKYDTIDKKNQVLITLPSLFKDDSYVDVISANIINQMREQMKSPEDGKIYWIDDKVDQYTESFEKIAPDQSFYINQDDQLVISFDKYAVAPGYMGNPEFVIPPEVLADSLVGNEYIR